MQNKIPSKLSLVAQASQQEKQDDPKLACFTFIIESRTGYVAEGYYPNVTPRQYQLIVAVLEGKADEPKIITTAA